jgi:two-component system OmpR family response regulator
LYGFIFIDSVQDWVTMNKSKVILFEANPGVTKTLSLALSKYYELAIFSNLKDGLRRIGQDPPTIIIIDLNISDLDGETVCHEVLKIGVKAPILIIGQDQSISTKLKYFKLGVEEYLAKPFSVGELIARLNIIQNRLKPSFHTIASMSNFPLILNKDNLSVKRDGGTEIFLRRKEYAILEYLIDNVGQIVSRQNLTQHAWKDSFQPWSNSVDVHIKYLRDKVDRPFSKSLITTIHGQGYRLELS